MLNELQLQWFTCSLQVRGTFPSFLSAMHCKSFRLTELHKLSLNDADLHVLSYYSSSIRSGVTSKMTLRSFHDLEVICRRLMLIYAVLYHPRVNGSRVTCYAYRLLT